MWHFTREKNNSKGYTGKCVRKDTAFHILKCGEKRWKCYLFLHFYGTVETNVWKSYLFLHIYEKDDKYIENILGVNIFM